MNTDVLASYTQNIAQGQKNYSTINAVYSGPLHPALHRNGAWPAHPNDPRGLEWPQVLNSLPVCLSACLLVLGKFSNFFLQYKAAAVQ